MITSGCTFSWSKKNLVNFNCDKFNPVCGENSVTYFNHCQAEDFEIETKYDGPCTGVIEVIPYNVPATAK
jgi:hypothetical protein